MGVFDAALQWYAFPTRSNTSRGFSIHNARRTWQSSTVVVVQLDFPPKCDASCFASRELWGLYWQHGLPSPLVIVRVVLSSVNIIMEGCPPELVFHLPTTATSCASCEAKGSVQ